MISARLNIKVGTAFDPLLRSIQNTVTRTHYAGTYRLIIIYFIFIAALSSIMSMYVT